LSLALSAYEKMDKMVLAQCFDRILKASKDGKHRNPKILQLLVGDKSIADFSSDNYNSQIVNFVGVQSSASYQTTYRRLEASFLDFKIIHIVDEVSEGRVKGLTEFKDQVAKNPSDYRMVNIQTSFHNLMLFKVKQLVEENDNKVLSQLFGFYKDLAIATSWEKNADSYLKRSPVMMGKFIGEVIGKFDEVQDWKKELKKSDHEEFDLSYRYTELVPHYAWKVGKVREVSNWLGSDNKDKRLALFKWLCCHPAGVKTISGLGENWRYGWDVNKILTQKEYFSFADDEEIPIVFRGIIKGTQIKDLVKKRKFKEALALGQEVMSLTAEEYPMLHDKILLECVEIHLKKKELAKAKSIFKKFISKEPQKELLKQKNKLEKQLKKKNNKKGKK